MSEGCRPRPARQWLCAPLLGVLLLGCGGDSQGEPSEADRYLELAGMPLELRFGFIEGERFTALAEGDACPIIEGLQGGTWVMPVIQARGLRQPITVEGVLRSETEELGFARNQVHFDLNEDWLEYNALPIPVTHEYPDDFEPIDDLFGAAGELEVTARDGVNEIVEMVPVVLSDGS